MWLSFKFRSPAHHTQHLVLVLKGLIIHYYECSWYFRNWHTLATVSTQKGGCCWKWSLQRRKNPWISWHFSINLRYKTCYTVCVLAHVCVHVHARMCVCICTHVCMHMHTCLCVCVCVCVCVREREREREREIWAGYIVHMGRKVDISFLHGETWHMGKNAYIVLKCILNVAEHWNWNPEALDRVHGWAFMNVLYCTVVLCRTS